MDKTIKDSVQILVDDSVAKRDILREGIPCFGTIVLLQDAIYKDVWTDDINDINNAVDIIEKSINQKGELRVPVNVLKEHLMEAIEDKKMLQREQLENQNRSWGMKL